MLVCYLLFALWRVFMNCDEMWCGAPDTTLSYYLLVWPLQGVGSSVDGHRSGRGNMQRINYAVLSLDRDKTISVETIDSSLRPAGNYSIIN